MTRIQQNCDPERLVDLLGGEAGCVSLPVSAWMGITSGSAFAHRGACCPSGCVSSAVTFPVPC